MQRGHSKEFKADVSKRLLTPRLFESSELFEPDEVLGNILTSCMQLQYNFFEIEIGIKNIEN